MATKKSAKKKPATARKKKPATARKKKPARKAPKKKRAATKKTKKKQQKKTKARPAQKRAAAAQPKPTPAPQKARARSGGAAQKGVPTAKATTTTPASTKPLWQKLHVKGGTVRVINAPAEHEGIYAGAPVTIASGNADTVHLWVNDDAELNAHLESAVSSVTEGGNLVISYPKGQKGLHRDTLWAALKPHGWEGIALFAVDDRWSAMRFRRAAA